MHNYLYSFHYQAFFTDLTTDLNVAASFVTSTTENCDLIEHYAIDTTTVVDLKFEIKSLMLENGCSCSTPVAPTRRGIDLTRETISISKANLISLRTSDLMKPCSVSPFRLTSRAYSFSSWRINLASREALNLPSICELSRSGVEEINSKISANAIKVWE